MQSLRAAPGTRSSSSSRGNSERARSPLVFGQRFLEILSCPVRPRLGAEIQLRIGRLPEQEIGEPLLVCAPDDQVRVGQLWMIEISAEGFLGERPPRPFGEYLVEGANNLVSAPIVDGKVHSEARELRGVPRHVPNFLGDIRLQALHVSTVHDPNAILAVEVILFSQ